MSPTRPPSANPRTQRRYVRSYSSAQGYGSAWRRIRARIILRDPICTVPTCFKPSTDADHILARAKGGTGDDENLRGMCHGHHSRKTILEDGGFGREPGRLMGSRGRRRG